MGEVTELRNWAELLPDALGLIFSHLYLQERLTIVSRVCKSWNHVVLGPYCWQTIDITDWSCWANPDHMDPMLRLLVSRSSGTLREFNVSGIQNDLTLAFLADHAQSLRSLQIPRSNISDSIIEQVADKLSGVTSIDLSYCCKIGLRVPGRETVRGCWDVDLDADWVQKLAPRVRVLGPHVQDRFEVDDDWLSCSDYSYDSTDDGAWDDAFSEFDASALVASFFEGWPVSP
ncbi:hypothetical protein LXL04_030126 [Taraxacum kok-saghyz]